ncbi:MAG: hypothetical protein C4334_06970 [Pyrinomonas sp.]|uniref:hypothetical protein n=1 Tax=Pyrinomonas sp. TaxID=2080306 RepID=UPI00331D3F77
MNRRLSFFALLLFATALAVPATSLAQSGPPARIREKKSGKFINGHDARDGRWDGRGPRRDKRGDRDDYDDEDDRRERGRKRHDRDRDGVDDRREIRRYAESVGYREGYRLGREDRLSGRRANYRDSGVYREATIGYRSEYGDIDRYRRSFREGFRRGYEDGYRDRSPRRRYEKIGDILGGVFGR